MEHFSDQGHRAAEPHRAGTLTRGAPLNDCYERVCAVYGGAREAASQRAAQRLHDEGFP